MKVLIFFVCLGIISASFAAETTTECVQMSEGERTNPKATDNTQPSSESTQTVTPQ